MKNESVKNVKKEEKPVDFKIIKGWIIAAISFVLTACVVIGAIFLTANIKANEYDNYTKEEAIKKATTYLNNRSSAYQNQEYDISTKTKLVFELDNMDEAYHLYYVTFESETITAVVKVNANTKVATLDSTSLV